MIRKLIPNLRELSLVDCSVSDNDIPSLFYNHSKFSTSLIILDLSSNKLTSSTFQLLLNFILNLQELYLSHINIVLSSLGSSFPSLVLVFQGSFNFSSKLQNLYLENCSLMDARFLCHLLSLSILHFLFSPLISAQIC